MHGHNFSLNLLRDSKTKRQHQEAMLWEAAESARSMQFPRFCDADEKQMQESVNKRRSNVNFIGMLDDEEGIEAEQKNEVQERAEITTCELSVILGT